MKDVSELSDVKRALLEKYLRGDVATATKVAVATPPAQEIPVSLPAINSRAPLVPIQSRGSKRPLFYTHVHWQGGAFYGFQLAQHLGPDQPFYILDPYKFEGISGTLPTMEEMAAEYVKTMRAVQPEGPYQLAAFCGGCLIAFEIAQQLQAAGQKVELLALIEPGVTGRMLPVLEQFGPYYLKFMSGMARNLGKFLHLGSSKSMDLYLNIRHLYRVFRYMGRQQGKSIPFFPTSEALRTDWIGIFSWITSSYVSRLYPGTITYFWAREEPPSRRRAWERMGLRAIATEYEAIAGTHDSCRNEDLPDLAAHLKGCLERVER